MPRDRRYGIAREWCGRTRPQHVVRFCDAWIGCAPTRAEATTLRNAHAAARIAALDAPT